VRIDFNRLRRSPLAGLSYSLNIVAKRQTRTNIPVKPISAKHGIRLPRVVHLLFQLRSSTLLEEEDAIRAQTCNHSHGTDDCLFDHWRQNINQNSSF
jgi:hypothetical protein